MMRSPIRLLLLLAALSGCDRQAEAPRAIPLDPEAIAVAVLDAQLFDEPARLQRHFSPSLRPEAFPLRLAADPGTYRFIDIWRLRSLDGRLVVEALVELGGARHVQLFWLERQAGTWRIAGWGERPEPLASPGPAPSAGITVPRAFAAPLLRGTAATPRLPVDAPLDQPAGTEHAMRAAVRLAEHTGRCGRAASLERALSAAGPPIATCAAPLGGRGGRLTLRVTLNGSTGRSEATLIETTLIDDGLRTCAESAFASLPLALGPGRACVAQVRVTLTAAP